MKRRGSGAKVPGPDLGEASDGTPLQTSLSPLRAPLLNPERGRT